MEVTQTAETAATAEAILFPVLYLASQILLITRALSRVIRVRDQMEARPVMMDTDP